MADGKTVTMATKVSAATAAQIDAVRGGLTRSAWLALAAHEKLAPICAAPAEPETPATPAPSPASAARPRQRPVTPAASCLHPKAQRTVIGGGVATICGACGSRL